MFSDNITVVKQTVSHLELAHQANILSDLNDAVVRAGVAARQLLNSKLMLMNLASRNRIVFEIVLSDSQCPSSFGFINYQTAARICDILNGLNSPVIHFDKRYIVSHLEGGACTAMTLNFLVRYFSLQNACLSKQNFDELIVNSIRSMPKRFSDEETRSMQGAFNTIVVARSTEDCSKLKAQALLSYYNFKIVEASKELDLFDNNPLATVIQHIRSLIDGVYFVRNLLPLNNYKMEYMGHSTAYIKQRGLHLYYDPNLGVIKINPEQSPLFVLKCFYEDCQLFNISRFRFYRILFED